MVMAAQMDDPRCLKALLMHGGDPQAVFGDQTVWQAAMMNPGREAQAHRPIDEAKCDDEASFTVPSALLIDEAFDTGLVHDHSVKGKALNAESGLTIHAELLLQFGASLPVIEEEDEA
jgi:hypothetical protein